MHGLLLRTQLSHVCTCVVRTDVRQVVVFSWALQVFVDVQGVLIVVEVCNLGRHDCGVFAVKGASVHDLAF